MRRPWALPLLPLYWLGLRTKNAFWNRRTAKLLAWPVVSVGSLSAGGAGKTPVTMALADLFSRHGVEVDVLSRGYGRGSGAVEQVDPAGPASRFGDEPLEMAQAGLRVFVAADRFEAGRLAEETGIGSGSGVHLLDDGFQHRRLVRTVNVVLLTLTDAQDWLLPAGNLREPLLALRRADAVILRDDEAPALYDLVRTRTKAPVWIVRRTLQLPSELPSDRPRRLLAFCAIARPESFFTMLQAAGVGEIVGQVTFPDHHPYRNEDYQRLAAAALDRGADAFVTTAKDAVKLSPAGQRLLEPTGPVLVGRLRVSFHDEPRVWRQIGAMLGWNDPA